MHFLKTKLIYIITGLMAVLCLAAVVISIRISVTLIEKKDQLVRPGSSAASAVKADAAPLGIQADVKKAQRHPVYFNGQEQSGVTYYTDDKGASFLPLDSILDQLGIKFKLFNSDDIFKTELGGKALLLTLGTNKGSYGGKSIDLGISTSALSNHIMASPELLGLIDGLKSGLEESGGGYFINYIKPPGIGPYSKARFLSISGDRPSITDIYGGIVRTYGKNGPGSVQDLVYDSELSAYILKSAGSIYYISGRNYKNPGILSTDKAYMISADGRFLYKEDKSKKTLYVYNVRTGVRKKVKDYLAGLQLLQGSPGQAASGQAAQSQAASGQASPFRLLDFQSGKRYTRLDFRETDNKTVYTIIERNSKVAEEGISSYSPDSGRILFKDSDGNYSEADCDGTNQAFLGNVDEAEWIDDNRVQFKVGDGYYIFDARDQSRQPVDSPLHFAGRTPDGGVFYTKDGILYQSADGGDKQISAVSRSPEFMAANSAKGPYLLLSDSDDSILCISGDAVLMLGKPSLFPVGQEGSLLSDRYGSNTALSPDKSRLAILQNGDKYVEINILDYKSMTFKKLTLDLPAADNGQSLAIEPAWLDNDSLLVRTPQNSWLVGTGKDSYVYRWPETVSSSFKGLLISTKK